jgi:PPOX class probable F420-dependent enzyme
MPDGQPQALPAWVDTDGEHILVNTEPQRQKARNAARGPRVTVLTHSADDPMGWPEVRGRVVSATDGAAAGEHIDFLSRRYTGKDHSAPAGPHGRVIAAVAADKINTPRPPGG